LAFFSRFPRRQTPLHLHQALIITRFPVLAFIIIVTRTTSSLVVMYCHWDCLRRPECQFAFDPKRQQYSLQQIIYSPNERGDGSQQRRVWFSVTNGILGKRPVAIFIMFGSTNLSRGRLFKISKFLF
jgi:hypothetical protein